MTTTGSPGPVDPKVYKRFLLFFFLLIIYLTLIPFQFDFSAESLSKGWQETEKIPLLRANGKKASGADIITNIIFFIPFGFFLMSYLLARKPNMRHGVLKTVLIAAGLSFSVELLQFMQYTRVTSINDLLSNIFGAFIGAYIVRRYFSLLDKTLSTLLHFYKTRPLFLVPTLLMLAHAVTLLIPFHFNFKLRRIKRHLYEWSDSLDALPLLSSQPLQRADLENFIFALGITCFLLLSIRWHFPQRPRYLSLLAFLSVPLFYLGITLLQLARQWHGPDAVVLISILLGIAGGGLLYAVLTVLWQRANIQGEKLYRQILIAAGGLYAAAFLVHSFYPFRLIAFNDLEAIRAELNLVPYATTLYKSSLVYYKHQFIFFVLAVVPGFILAKKYSLRPTGERIFRVLGAALLIALVVESVQLFIPTQPTDITDFIIFILGATAGMALASYWRDHLWNTQIEQATLKLKRMLTWSSPRRGDAKIITPKPNEERRSKDAEAEPSIP